MDGGELQPSNMIFSAAVVDPPPRVQPHTVRKVLADFAVFD